MKYKSNSSDNIGEELDIKKPARKSGQITESEKRLNRNLNLLFNDLLRQIDELEGRKS